MVQKLIKPAGQQADEFENTVATALQELEDSSAEMKADLRGLYISAAKEVDVGQGKKAVVLFVPVPLLRNFHKVQVRLVRELEKKFSGRHVVIVAQRRILRKPARNARQPKQPRPRSRTLTAVHDSILDDLAYPTEIVGKRIRIKLDGSKLYKVHLDKKEKNNVEYKLDTFGSVYKALTGKDVVFEFPSQE
eukprot:Clim_evm3s241 gene=Clim_evmTU3s241